jgi:hypothetical protein
MSERRRSSWSEDLNASASILAPKNQNLGTSLHGSNSEQPLARLARPGLSTFSKSIFSRWRTEGGEFTSTPSILHPEKYTGNSRKPRTGQTCANTFSDKIMYDRSLTSHFNKIPLGKLHSTIGTSIFLNAIFGRRRMKHYAFTAIGIVFILLQKLCPCKIITC